MKEPGNISKFNWSLAYHILLKFGVPVMFEERLNGGKLHYHWYVPEKFDKIKDFIILETSSIYNPLNIELFVHPAQSMPPYIDLDAKKVIQVIDQLTSHFISSILSKMMIENEEDKDKNTMH